MRVMQFKKVIAAAALLLALAVLSACGGGGSNVAGGGVGGSGVAVASVGTVTGFGSVIVNGIAYGTSDTEVFIENVSKGSGDETIARHLSTGMVVRIEGVLTEDGSSTANRVFFNNDLRGPVESVAELDPFSLQMVLLSQTVVLTPFCVYQNT